MKITITLIITAFIMMLATEADKNAELARKIKADKSLLKVEQMARVLMKKGFYAGSGYQMVWSRDLNTFIELSCEEYDPDIIRENLIMFFHFQRENGEMLDGYVEREGFTWDDPNTYESETAPGHIGFKNTVETDQETSLIQLIAKYIDATEDWSILKENVAGKTVYQRLAFSIEYLLKERYTPDYGLITGATTFDWGDVQVEGGAVVDIDELTHWSIDVYDNAMLVIALKDMVHFASGEAEKQKWQKLQNSFTINIKKYLWDNEMNKFIPHIYLNDSPFPENFDENAIHYHGGTAVAIEAGILNLNEISLVTAQMIKNVQLSGAATIGLTLYPPYPIEVLGKGVSAPYQYQNGGDWTWFGGRMIQQLIKNGFVDEAYELVKPMCERVINNNGFYEWYKIDGTPAGSAEFKGSAGVLSKSIIMLREWAAKNSNPED
jgi:hypothetical protein